MKTFVSGRPYWWQWFTILSLDATSVGLVWQAMFARAASVDLRPAHRVILASSIWCAYTADRWIEGWRLLPEQTLTQRHHFSIRWRWPLAIIWTFVFAADLYVAHTLSRREFVAGLVLLVPVLLYLLSHQFLHRQHPWRLPKEICVALLMAGGVAVFVASQPGVQWTPLITLGTGFTLLCFTNCALISIWEREVDETHGQESLARRFHRITRAVHGLPWITAGGALLGACIQSSSTVPGLLSLAASALLLGAVDTFEPKLGRQLARVLADVVLLTPVFVFLWPAP